MVSVDKLLDTANFCSGKATTTLEPTRVKPELRYVIVALDVNMWGFIPIPRIEKETIWPDSEYRWQFSSLSCRFSGLTSRARPGGPLRTTWLLSLQLSMLYSARGRTLWLRGCCPAVSIHFEQNCKRAALTSSRLLVSPVPYVALAVSFTPSARATLRTVSKRGLAPGVSALYKLSRPRPVSLAI